MFRFWKSSGLYMLDKFLNPCACRIIMKLILVRHGETDANRDMICQGHMNSHLTQKGLRQARLVAERLKYFPIDIAYSSDLDRALDTCKEILRYHPQTNIKITKVL